MKVYRVMNSFPGEENGRHEYNLYVEESDKGTKYSLIRSQAGHWSEDAKGQTVVAIMDDGDSMLLSKHVTKNLQYDTAAELFILMSFINKQGMHNCFFMGTIEKIENVVSI